MSADAGATGSFHHSQPDSGPRQYPLASRWLRVASAVVLTVFLVLVLAACTESQASEGLVTDSTTLRIAKVEAERMCAIGETSFPQESGIGDDLVDRLKAAGLTYEQWETWRAQLASSPDLVAQYEAEQEAACPDDDEADAETS